MSRTGFQYALSALGAVVAGDVDHGVLTSIHAGLAAAAATGRELSDLEQLALDNLMGQLCKAPEAALSVPSPEPVEGEEAGGAEAPEAEVTQPEAGAENPAPATVDEELLTEPVTPPPFQPQEDEEAEHVEDDGA